MVKTFGPLQSQNASGTIGKTITHSSWKGRSYARRHVTPADPATADQLANRVMFKWLTQVWSGISTTSRATWSVLADELRVTNFNAFIYSNLRGWHNFLFPGVTYPINREDPPSNGQITAVVYSAPYFTITHKATQPRDGWTIAIMASQIFMPSQGITELIAVDQSEDNDFHDVLWRPTAMGMWFFQPRTGSIDGTRSAAGATRPAST